MSRPPKTPTHSEDPSESYPDIRKFLESIPYAQTLGVKPFFMGEEFTLILPYKRENIGNPTLPALHGGGVGGFMEVCAIAQLFMGSKAENLSKPIGINIDYLRRGKPIETYARADIFRQEIGRAHV